MALRNQPYLPLYVKDFLTDEKLIECSAEATGVYIRLMCIMHNSQDYGQLKLSDKYNDEDQIKNYSNMLVKQMPYAYEIIYKSLEELLKEKVIFFDKNILTQKRMFNDGKLSIERAKAGKKGGKHSKQNVSKTSSKSEANTENEIVVVIDNNNVINKEDKDKIIREEKETNIEILNFIENNIRTITSYEYEFINDSIASYGKDIVLYAYQKAFEADKKSMNYVKGILKSWKQDDLTTIEQIKLNENKPKNKKTSDERMDEVFEKLKKEGKL